MITVTEFDNICQDIVSAIEIDGYVIASTEEQGKRKLRDKSGVQLVAVYPDYSIMGDQDTYRPAHELLFFVVIREKEAQDNSQELQQYQITQDAIIKLKKYLLGETSEQIRCKVFPYNEVDTVAIDPEYNIFGGYLGWSLKIIV